MGLLKGGANATLETQKKHDFIAHTGVPEPQLEETDGCVGSLARWRMRQKMQEAKEIEEKVTKIQALQRSRVARADAEELRVRKNDGDCPEMNF